MNKENILKELNELKMKVEYIILEVEKCEDLQVVNKSYLFNVIRKFVRENGNLLGKDEQKSLSSKLWVANKKESISISNACKMCEINYKYEGDGEWKDIRIEIE